MAKIRNERILPSTTITATGVTADQEFNGAIGGHIIIKTTNIVGTPNVTCTIQGKDSQTGTYYTILTGSAISTATSVVMRVFPGMASAANTVANDFLPAVWRVSYVLVGSTSLDLEIAANLVE